MGGVCRSYLGIQEDRALQRLCGLQFQPPVSSNKNSSCRASMSTPYLYEHDDNKQMPVPWFHREI